MSNPGGCIVVRAVERRPTLSVTRASHEPNAFVDPRAPLRAGGLNRGGVALVALLAVLLLSDGREPLDAFSRGSAAGPTNENVGALSASEIATHMRAINPELTDRELERIAAAVIRYSARYELDAGLVVGVIMAESSARPWARSPKGAMGLMQVMPYMMGSLDVAGNLTSVESNVEAGCMILADNIRRLGERRGILAYFWGNDIRGASYLERVEAARASLRPSL